MALSDEDIMRAAADMTGIYGVGAMAKAEEYIEGLNSKESYSLPKMWEVIGDKIRELQENQHLCEVIGRDRH